MLMSYSFIQMAQVNNPHNEYIEDVDELARVIGRLDDKARKLLVENTKLRRNNEELKTQNEELTSEIVGIILQQRISGSEDLKSENEDLKSENEDLKSENEELTSENDKLKKQLEEFKEKIMQLNFVLKFMGHPQPDLEENWNCEVGWVQNKMKTK